MYIYNANVRMVTKRFCTCIKFYSNEQSKVREREKLRTVNGDRGRRLDINQCCVYAMRLICLYTFAYEWYHHLRVFFILDTHIHLRIEIEIAGYILYILQTNDKHMHIDGQCKVQIFWIENSLQL